jgi:hypothetical protein
VCGLVMCGAVVVAVCPLGVMILIYNIRLEFLNVYIC